MSQRASAEAAADQATEHGQARGVALAALAGLPRSLGQGVPLPAPVRSTMETRLGHDLADVRIHADTQADRQTWLEGATAFTQGTDIAFRRGAYDPGSTDGKRLLAHELTHVVQQRVARRQVLQRQDASVDWQVEARGMTDEELQSAVDRLELELQAATESSPETEQKTRELDILHRIQTERQSGIAAARAVTTARRAVTTGLVSRTDSTAVAAAVVAIELDTSVQGLFGLGFLAGCQAAIPPAELDEFSSDLREHLPTFYGGYLYGLPVGLGHGLVNLIQGLGMIVQLGISMSPPALMDAATTEAWHLILSSEHRALRRRQYEQLQRLNAALTALLEEFSSDPTILMQWSNELGIAAGEEFGRSLTTGFFRTTVFEQGQAVGDVVGQILFEVLLEILLAFATEGIGNVLRGVAAGGEGAAAGGRLARLLKQAMEASPAVRRLIEIASEGSAAAGRGERLADAGAEAARTGERVVEGADAARTGERLAEGERGATRTAEAAAHDAPLAESAATDVAESADPRSSRWNPFSARKLREFWPPNQISREIVQGVEMQGLEKVGGGGRIWASTDVITANHVEELATRINGGSGTGGRAIDIITGTHGDETGFLTWLHRETKFLMEDFGALPSATNINVHDISRLSDAELTALLENNGDTILAWCHSERSRRIVRALGLDF